MLRTLVVVGVTLAVTGAPARSAFAGACATPMIPTEALTPTGTALAKDGGVVMAGEDSAKPAAWRFAGGKDKQPAKARVVGPGLWVLPAPDGAWSLADEAGKVRLAGTHAATDPKPLAAPRITSVKFFSSSGRRGTFESVTVNIKGPLPADATAIVVLDAQGAVRSWGNPRLTDTTQPMIAVGVFQSGSCTALPNGTVPTTGGDKIKLAWIDSSGRLSATTSATVIAEKPVVQPGGP